ncbi:hypothetical protein E5206_09550 [Arthrobacter sp. PAMC25564]|uniref:hypothetical protein n=1 Tax=Arthrobacter sp. PAMC25564 TaxID=2565366 RepID=UPI0010A28D25|nr:hypothetical protein [Arthrobacter sp. PAMC25564]QCB97147.1 hypothetical protein E5206_09550 [Arthrobacter sp. PAMC25564]
MAEVEALASFIAHARTDIPALLAMVRDQQAALERVRELHVPVMEDGSPVGCALCDWEHDDGMTWPCGTLAAITATEGA